MNTTTKKTASDESGFYYRPEKRIQWLVFSFVISGIFVAVLWLCLFVAGLLVDSSYYRAAISYKFATPVDWLLAISTFTFSNVILLAFMSGLLGGITSKMLYTKGFRITTKELNESNSFQIENPFISAFRGMFVFIAILFMQYVSSYTDMGTINKVPEQEQKEIEIRYEKIYGMLAEREQDTMILQGVRSEIEKMMLGEKITEPDTSVINRIHFLKSELKELSRKDTLNNSEKSQKKGYATEIRSIRRNLKVPSKSDFSGIGLSSFSYFKFAVIVSFLSFIFGYDPSLFTEFLGKIFKKPGSNNPEAK